ncbi:MAG: HAD family phosphatase [Candidatus Omnitrophota bacterium]
MKYKLIIFDIDGTITTHVSSWQFIHEELGIWDETAKHYQDEFFAGKISYRRFCELDAAHWKGMREKDMRAIFKSVPYTKNIVASIKKLKAMGFKLAAVSTGLQFLADRVTKDLGFDYAVSNRLLSKNGILTGKVKINIAHGAKGDVLNGILKRFRVKAREIISIGDTAGDIPLAKLSGYSIAFNSSSKLLSKMVNYNCASHDFDHVFKKIVSTNT